MAKNIAVLGIYASEASAQDGFALARERGFRDSDISILAAENSGSKDFAHTKSTKSPEGATVGAGSGAVIGGTLGWLAGIGSLAIPGIGLFIAAGPIMGLLAGIGAGGAVGGVLGGLIGMGVPEYEAKRYEGRIRKGGILVSIHSDDSEWASKAKEVLRETGAEDISTTSEEKADFAVSDKPMTRRAWDPKKSERSRARGKNSVVDLMNRDVETVGIDTRLDEASERMRSKDVPLLVVRSSDAFIGVVTDEGISEAVRRGYDPTEATVRVALTQNYPYFFESQTSAEAAAIMEDRQVRNSLVLNEDRQVVGVLSADAVRSERSAGSRSRATPYSQHRRAQ
jgi:CBS domain-containing protein